MMKAWIVDRGIYFHDTSEVLCICSNEAQQPTRTASVPRNTEGGREVKMLACGGGGGGGGR